MHFQFSLSFVYYYYLFVIFPVQQFSSFNLYNFADCMENNLHISHIWVLLDWILEFSILKCHFKMYHEQIQFCSLFFFDIFVFTCLSIYQWNWLMAATDFKIIISYKKWKIEKKDKQTKNRMSCWENWKCEQKKSECDNSKRLIYIRVVYAFACTYHIPYPYSSFGSNFW